MKFVVLLLCLLAIFTRARADCPPPAISQTLPPLNFAVPDVYPWGYLDANHEPAGLLPEFMARMAAQNGLRYRSTMMPYSRIVHTLQSGSIDVGVLMDDQVYENVETIGKVVDLKILIVTRANSDPLRSADDLAGKRIGLLRGWQTAQQLFDEHGAAAVQVNSVQQGLAMLLGNRLDAMTGTPYSMPPAIHSMNLDPARLNLDFTLGYGSMSLYIARDSLSADVLHSLQQALVCIESAP